MDSLTGKPGSQGEGIASVKSSCWRDYHKDNLSVTAVRWHATSQCLDKTSIILVRERRREGLGEDRREWCIVSIQVCVCICLLCGDCRLAWPTEVRAVYTMIYNTPESSGLNLLKMLKPRPVCLGWSLHNMSHTVPQTHTLATQTKDSSILWM